MATLPEFKIEVATEADVEGGMNCSKNPGHVGFIPFKDFAIDHLSQVWQEERIFEYIRNVGESVVRLIVTGDEGQRNYGSGLVEKWAGQYVIATNHHVIENEKQAKRCIIEFDFNSEDRSDVIVCEGTGLLETSEELDKTLITFQHVPKKIYDLNLVDETLFIPEVASIDENGQSHKYQALVMPNKVNDAGILIMPFTCELNKAKETMVHFHEGTISKLASDVMKFEPIPEELRVGLSNRNLDLKLTVVIADIKGKMKTMTGKIEFIEGEVFIKLPEALTDKEAQQCTVTFPDGSVSKGTGVHFLPTTLTTANLQGLDINLDNLLATGIPAVHVLANKPFWSLAFKPIPRGLEEQLDIQKTNNTQNRRLVHTAIVIGHPHGGRKMVTIGKHLPLGTLECTERGFRFSICYSCKTCRGSSGSPVLYLRSCRWYIHTLGGEGAKCKGEIVETGNLSMAFWWKKYVNDIFIGEST
ncbi:uncharacterized protein LOC130012343 [Patella vulgata]|uniref:uncharacterized protein LOC130012343 n=1 Tax=Patella vulgata TaxID=6465 RepID=UPI0024A8B041|nr:uncharacterized protein LOC130012343 [Patella vulgata]